MAEQDSQQSNSLHAQAQKWRATLEAALRVMQYHGSRMRSSSVQTVKSASAQATGEADGPAG